MMKEKRRCTRPLFDSSFPGWGRFRVEGQRTDYDSISRINVRFARDASRDAEKLERFAVERRRFREKLGSKLDFTRNTDRKSFSFFACPALLPARPPRPPPLRSIDRSPAREMKRRQDASKMQNVSLWLYYRSSVLHGTRWAIFFFQQSYQSLFFFFFFLPINLINTFIDDPFFRSYKITPLLIRSKKYSIDDNRESIISFT